jgi:hypothetical protein
MQSGILPNEQGDAAPLDGLIINNDEVDDGGLNGMLLG